MSDLAIIGGSGFTKLEELKIVRREVIHTPFGEPSSPLVHGIFNGLEVVFLPRHGSAHTIPPHKVNYRANLWALSHIGIKRVIGVAAVGGIRKDMAPGSIVIPDQIIDYTYGRSHTYFETDLSHVTHIDFTEPYCNELRNALIEASESAGIDLITNGTYGATQGPRLETAKEIDRMGSDGCDLVGMTGMPEAALARELGVCYASCSVVANWAAGRSDGPITMDEIEKHLIDGMERVRKLLSIFAGQNFLHDLEN
ncbi:S-methyl-5'-thioinosine phosphorylase [Solemya velesiana gill symbiont]|uniref:Probable S-methyl-5'-thioinosine phosphorylase n=1 Tax=Solemya velesiana gill symbiont TaxID=1918948 RepID=A0A1T2KX74_9GAMM|nr:S-methyl-5'-thioinosine phosphorylase [Solemya velesiana gill symbiont]OOZ37391.1 methylthioadenosine phosphorylase [Solemya velesiana gill symbiont]